MGHYGACRTTGGGEVGAVWVRLMAADGSMAQWVMSRRAEHQKGARTSKRHVNEARAADSREANASGKYAAAAAEQVSAPHGLLLWWRAGCKATNSSQRGSLLPLQQLVIVLRGGEAGADRSAERQRGCAGGYDNTRLQARRTDPGFSAAAAWIKARPAKHEYHYLQACWCCAAPCNLG